MEIVVKISDDMIKSLEQDNFGAKYNIYDLVGCLMNGTLLPKGHGALITKEQAINLVEFYQLNPQHFDFVNLIDEIKDEKTIIEADKESYNNARKE